MHGHDTCVIVAFLPPYYALCSPMAAAQQQAIQWFGVDVGGSLVKGVYYETQESTGQRCEGEGVASMKKFIKSNLKYGSTGIRDQRLEMHGQKIGGYTGTLHFIKFATSRMDGFFDMVTNNGLSRFPKVVCGTGGGAFKFEKAFQEVSTLLTHMNVQCPPPPPQGMWSDIHSAFLIGGHILT